MKPADKDDGIMSAQEALEVLADEDRFNQWCSENTKGPAAARRELAQMGIGFLMADWVRKP